MASASFSSLPLARPLLDVLDSLGLREMTAIQVQAIPPLLEGRDVIGQSRTGSGKTVAFALPILNSLDLKVRQIQALIMCPTRELSAQVTRELRKLGSKLPGLQVLQVAGGEPAKRQREILEGGVHIVVGTPGRLVDHLQRESLDFSELRCIVLDEADRMLDMGFTDEVTQVLDAAPTKRQTACFSATFPEAIESYLRNPVRVTVEETLAIQQFVYSLEGDTRTRALLDVLGTLQAQSAIVFCNAKLTVAEVEQALSEKGVVVAALHGDMEQPERDRVMARFRNRSVRVLVATDVAARGLDISDLDVVVNFDIPLQPEVYIHRVGRTARAGKQGVAVTLAGPAEARRIEALGQPLEKWKRSYKAPPEVVQGAAMVTMHVSAGRKDKLRPGDILGALTAEGLIGDDVGKIEIHERFSYVAIAKAKTIPPTLRIKGRKVKITPVK